MQGFLRRVALGLLCFLTLCSSAPVMAESLVSQSLFYVDKTTQMAIDEVDALPRDRLHEIAEGQTHLSLPLRVGAAWIKLPPIRKDAFVLIIDEFMLDSVDLYCGEGLGKWDVQKEGAMVARHASEYRHYPGRVFKLKPHDRCWIRFESVHSPMIISPQAFTQADFVNYVIQRHEMRGEYVAFFIAIILLGIGLWLIDRDDTNPGALVGTANGRYKKYMFYMLHVLGGALHLAAISGYAADRIPVWYALGLQQSGAAIGAALSQIGTTLFVAYFLALTEKQKLLQIRVAVGCVVALLVSVTWHHPVGVIMVTLGSLITMLLNAYQSLNHYLRRQRDIPTFLVVLATWIFLLGGLAAIPRAWGLVEPNFITLYAIYIALPMDMACQLVALLYRIHVELRRSRDAAKREAEGATQARDQANSAYAAAKAELNQQSADERKRQARARKALSYYHHEIIRGMWQFYNNIRLINDYLEKRDITTAKIIGQRIKAEVMDIQHGAENFLLQAQLTEEDDQAIKSVTQLTFEEDFENRINWFRLLAANDRKKTITITSQELGARTMSGSKTMVRAQIDNLLSNAVKHAKSQVQVTLRHTKNTSELIVEDDGLGFPVGEQQSITNLDCVIGEKGSESYYPHGHGLGLELVKQFASIQGADIRVGRSKLLGGALVSIQYRT